MNSQSIQDAVNQREQARAANGGPQRGVRWADQGTGGEPLSTDARTGEAFTPSNNPQTRQNQMRQYIADNPNDPKTVARNIYRNIIQPQVTNADANSKPGFTDAADAFKNTFQNGLKNGQNGNDALHSALEAYDQKAPHGQNYGYSLGRNNPLDQNAPSSLADDYRKAQSPAPRRNNRPDPTQDPTHASNTEFDQYWKNKGLESASQRDQKFNDIFDQTKGDPDKTAAQVRDTFVPEKYRADFDQQYSDMKKSGIEPKEAIGAALDHAQEKGGGYTNADTNIGNEYGASANEYEQAHPGAFDDHSTGASAGDRAADGKTGSGQSADGKGGNATPPANSAPAPETHTSTTGTYVDDPSKIPGITTTDALGKYHNAVNERNKEMAALKDAKANNAPADQISALIQKAKNADGEAQTTFSGMNDADKAKAKSEDDVMGQKTTPATDPASGGKVDGEIAKIEPKYGQAVATAQKAAQAGTDAATQAAQEAQAAGKSAPEITQAATSAAGKAASAVMKAAGPAAAVAASAITDGLNIKNLVDAVRSGDKGAIKNAGVTLAADWATGGLYSLVKMCAPYFTEAPGASNIAHLSARTGTPQSWHNPNSPV